MKKTNVTVLLIFVTLISYSQNGTEPIKVTDMLKVKSIGAVTLTKDGSQAAFTVTAVEPEDSNKWEYKYVTQIWMAPSDGSKAPRQLTFATPGSSQPVWSPDGKQLAFVRSVDGKSQIFVLSMNGGEPVQFTKHKYGAVSPRWSSDGKQLLFMASIPMKDMLTDSILNPNNEMPLWNFEKPGFSNNANLKTNTAKADPDGNLPEVRAYLENNEKDKKAKVINKLQFQEESTTSSDLSFTHIFIMNADPESTPKAITKGYYSFFNPQFIEGTAQLLIEGNTDEQSHPDRTLENEIFIVNKDGSGLKKILGKKNMTYNSVSVSPSGKQIAFQYGNTGFVTVPSLAIMPVNGTEKDIVEIPFDRNKTAINWSDDEQYVYFTSPSNGGFILSRADVKNKKPEQLTTFESGVGSYAIKNNKLVFIKTEVTDPFEVYSSDASAKNAKPISTFNSGWLKSKKIIVPEKRTFTNEKGLTIEYWIMRPANFQQGKKFPVVLEIHGGPSAMWGPGESTMWHEFQFWCGKGYGVVYCNPRGSGGYGLDFLRANVNDWGKGPMTDVLTALNKSTAEAWMDTSRLTVTGGSYAGYLIAYMLAHDHRFKAACSQRGVYDLRTFFGEGNAWRLVPDYFGGYPWEKNTLSVLERESPITYVQNITTPFIIFHGENDLRTGVTQSEQLYKSLKVLGRPVEYVRHPGATHEITRSGNNRQRIDQMLRTWEFFERWTR